MASRTYSKKGNVVHIFELRTTIHNTKQGDLSTTAYYNTMAVIWQELNLYQHLHVKALENAVMLAKMLE